METLRTARDRGGQYLLEQMGENGALPRERPDIAEYYKALTAFQVCGHNAAANRLADWIRQHGLTASGDFGPRADTESYAYTYFNAWVVTGAHRLGQFDLSYGGMRFLKEFYDAESGGFYSSAHDRDANTKQDLMVVSMCGLAALYTGETEIARGTGRWLRQVMEAQPDFPRRLYTVYSHAQGLHTQPPDGEEMRYVVHSDVTRDQAFFNPGIAAGFLARLFQATGDQSCLELAKEYLRFAENATDYLFRLIRAGKVAWGASVLYTLTGESKYRDMAVRIGDNLLALQHDDGGWGGVDQPTSNNDSTAERVVWLDEILQAVSER